MRTLRAALGEQRPREAVLGLLMSIGGERLGLEDESESSGLC